jgi:hypothetical protein
MRPAKTNLVQGYAVIGVAALYALASGGAALATCVLLMPVWALGVGKIVRLRPRWKEVLASFGSSIPVLLLAVWIAHLLLQRLATHAGTVLSVLPAVMAGLAVSTYWMAWRIEGSRGDVSRLFEHCGEIAWAALVVGGGAAIAIPAYQDYTIAAKGVRACPEYQMRATFDVALDAFDVDEQAQVLLALPANDAAKPGPELPQALAGWSVVSKPGSSQLGEPYFIQRRSRSTATTGLGVTQVHRLGYGELIEMCRVKTFQLVAPEHVMLRENLVEAKASDILMEGEDAIAITAADVVDPPVEVRVARRPFRHALLVSLTGVTVSSSVTAVLSGIGTVLLFLAESVRDFLVKHFLDPLLKKLPFLKRRRKPPVHKHGNV